MKVERGGKAMVIYQAGRLEDPPKSTNSGRRVICGKRNEAFQKGGGKETNGAETVQKRTGSRSHMEHLGESPT